MTRPIGPYQRAPLDLRDWDPATVDVARDIGELIADRDPRLTVEHIGSTAVPGLPGKNVVDLAIEADPPEIPGISDLLENMGFQRTTGPRAFPPTRPLLIGSCERDGREHRLHLHVHPRGHRVYGREHARDLAFRDALRADAALRDEYATRKRAIAAAGISDTYRYSLAKTEWIRDALGRLGFADPPILPPATIGILGGGQLGRMMAMAARHLGYRVAVLDPDPGCPAAPVSDHLVVGRYDDVDAALELAARCDVVTVELEHVGPEVIETIDRDWPLRPGVYAVTMTRDRLEERRFLDTEGAPVAPWREVATTADVEVAAAELGLPLRLKAATGGYDGRSQVRVATADDIAGALARLGRPDGETVVAERELEFVAELSVVCARGIDGRSATFEVARNRHDEGILIESVSPAGIDRAMTAEAQALAARLAEALDLVGTLTVELFQMPDGSLVVNELAPRVHNSGHWSIEAAATSQFEQHIRAICALPLGSTALRAGGAATVNLLGAGADRDARPTGLDRAMAEPDVHVHLYDKRRVFERRKMGHVTAIARSAEEALSSASRAAAAVEWEA